MSKYLLFTAGLLVFFAFAGQAIISVKLVELRTRIQRERILNLELSSQALQARSRRLAAQREDFRSEIRQAVIESGLLNTEQPRALEPGLAEYAGLGAINAARILAFKPLLYLIADYETLLRMRYAFYLERNRRYPAAIRRYRELEELTGDRQGDVQAFVTLHLAYCLATVGERTQAIDYLKKLQRDYAGTHFSRAAAVLLHVLQEAGTRSARWQRIKQSDLERARALVHDGLCPAALTAYAAHEQSLTRDAATAPHAVSIALGPMDRYRQALCYEETGQIQAAIRGYQSVVRAGGDRRAVVLANRRLLIVGHFYAGDRQALREATISARRLGDLEALGEITAVARKQKAPIVLAEIRRLSEAAAARETTAQDARDSDPDLTIHSAADPTGKLAAEIYNELLGEVGPVWPAAEPPPIQPAANHVIPQSDAVDPAAALRRILPPSALLLREIASAGQDSGTIVFTADGTVHAAGELQIRGDQLWPTQRTGATAPRTAHAAPNAPRPIALQAITLIRAEPIDGETPGLLEVALRDQRVLYGTVLRYQEGRFVLWRSDASPGRGLAPGEIAAIRGP